MLNAEKRMKSYC